MVVILRHMIGDLDDSPTYSDNRLQELLLSSAIMVEVDVGGFAKQEYDINVASLTLTPDPTASATRDIDFIALVTLKAACRLAYSELRSASTQGIRVKDGRSELDLRDRIKGHQAMVDGEEGSCKRYDKAVLQYRVGTGGVGKAILGPFSGESTGGLGGRIISPDPRDNREGLF